MWRMKCGAYENDLGFDCYVMLCHIVFF